eukprot:1157881-Pelagomonas_calceolata.AAC.4
MYAPPHLIQPAAAPAAHDAILTPGHQHKLSSALSLTYAQLHLIEPNAAHAAHDPVIAAHGHHAPASGAGSPNSSNGGQARHIEAAV